MKKYIPILCIFLMIQFSCSELRSEKQQEIEKFQSEMKRINDSSAYYFDKGIKLLKAGVDPTEIGAKISSKLTYYRTEINKKSMEFRISSKKLGIPQAEYDSIFRELMKSYQVNVDKYKYLAKNGVKLN